MTTENNEEEMDALAELATGRPVNWLRLAQYLNKEMESSKEDIIALYTTWISDERLEMSMDDENVHTLWRAVKDAQQVADDVRILMSRQRLIGAERAAEEAKRVMKEAYDAVERARQSNAQVEEEHDVDLQG